ncbi:MAG: MATE family efflux transporter [Flavobacterium sp.]
MDKSVGALGSEPIGLLLKKQAIPASVGILFMSINIIVDTIFVGQWIGSIAIAAVTVVLPFTFLISSIGMAIGVGGASIISRALGAKEVEKAKTTFGNQLVLTLAISVILMIIGMFFSTEVLTLFGAKGAILEPAREFYFPVLATIPFLALCMMGNNVIRAEGKPKFAMYAMIIPAIGNILLDILLIKIIPLGMFGAALATAISYFLCFAFVFWFFWEKSSLQLSWHHLQWHRKIVKEIASLGMVTFSRQGMVSLVAILVNQSLFIYGGEVGISMYGIINRMMMFSLFPILGITHGFLPIAGYNYGAEQWQRVREVVYTSIKVASILSTIIFVVIVLFQLPIVKIFTNDAAILAETPFAMVIVFAATPIIALQLIGAAYFQAIGKAIPALLLTLTKQGFFLIPLLGILPLFFGIFGIWLAFPIADTLATLVTAYFLRRELQKTLKTSLS